MNMLGYKAQIRIQFIKRICLWIAVILVFIYVSLMVFYLLLSPISPMFPLKIL